MNAAHMQDRSFAVAFVCFLIMPLLSCQAEPGSDLAAQLKAKQAGSTYVRMRMETGGDEKQTFQLQIKSRLSETGADVVYQVLFPKERKGEAVLLHRSGEKFAGTLFIPPNDTHSIAPGRLSQPLFGSDLSYEDIIDDPFNWRQQAIVGTEVINGAACQILESKPNEGQGSSYSRVRTWVDPRRLVPLRIEKYDATGQVLRRITTTRVLLAGDESVPANLSVQGPRGTTEIDGSRIKRAVTYADTEFTPQGLRNLSVPADAP
jgi:outer membrane lipoprotein-sorting protein